MTRIICRASNCVYWEHGECGSDEIEYEPDDGCLTFEDMGDLALESVDDDEEDEDLEWEGSAGSVAYADEEEETEDWEEDWDD
jgi:hypothetical protein